MRHPQLKALILDMDGVLWRDDQPIGDLHAIFDEISRRNLKVTLATNNATLSVDQYLRKLESFGVSLRSEQIVNSSLAAAQYLSHRFPEKGNVYIVGEEGIFTTLRQNGFDHSQENVLAVVGSLDRQLTFEKLKQATRIIRSGVPFIGTNPDPTFPTPNGLIPGTGAILAAIEAATQVRPVIVGKPSPEMYILAIDRMNSSPKETLVVGDRLETDIIGAQKIGCPTALVLSGVTGAAAASAWNPAPDYIVEDLAALLAVL